MLCLLNWHWQYIFSWCRTGTSSTELPLILETSIKPVLHRPQHWKPVVGVDFTYYLIAIDGLVIANIALAGTSPRLPTNVNVSGLPMASHTSSSGLWPSAEVTRA